MSVSIASLIARTKRGLPRLLVPENGRHAALDADGEALGIYRNQNDRPVVFTTKGLRAGKDRLICYEDIVGVGVAGEKHVACRLDLSLRNGSSQGVTFDGGNGRCRDVWEILRLVNRIRSAARFYEAEENPAPVE